MATKIVVLSTEGESREDGNVYYSRFLIVKSKTGKFDEPVFQTSDLDAMFKGEPEPSCLSDEKTIEAIIALGYDVEEPDVIHVTYED